LIVRFWSGPSGGCRPARLRQRLQPVVDRIRAAEEVSVGPRAEKHIWCTRDLGEAALGVADQDQAAAVAAVVRRPLDGSVSARPRIDGDKSVTNASSSRVVAIRQLTREHGLGATSPAGRTSHGAVATRDSRPRKCCFSTISRLLGRPRTTQLRRRAGAPISRIAGAAPSTSAAARPCARPTPCTCGAVELWVKIRGPGTRSRRPAGTSGRWSPLRKLRNSCPASSSR
jgi:hypothetical protein